MKSLRLFAFGQSKRTYSEKSNVLTVNESGDSCKLAYVELRQRIKAARKAAKLTQDELAKRVGVSRPAVNMWESGKTNALDGRNLVLTAYATNVNPLWLATGEGHMRIDEVRDEVYDLPPELKKSWRLLDRKLREHVLALLEALQQRR